MPISRDIPYLEAGWFQTLRKFLCFISAEIHIDNLQVPQTLQANDHAFMESFLNTHNFSDTDLYRLNLCRIYLRVKFLSKICNPEGDNLLPEVWQGRQPQESSSDLLWPKQARPFQKYWSLWRHALKLAYLSPEVLRATTACTTILPLNVPLGPWIGERHRSQSSWNSYVSTDSQVLYQKCIVGYRLHRCIESTF